MDTGRNGKDSTGGTVRITSCLTLEERERLRKTAGRRGLSCSAYINTAIKSELDRADGTYNEDECMITMREFSKMIHVSVPKAIDICRSGGIAYYLMDGSYRIKLRDAKAYIESTRIETNLRKDQLIPLYTIAEVAGRYHVTPQTVDNWIRQGKMPAYRIDGRHVRIKKEDMDCMLSEYGIG